MVIDASAIVAIAFNEPEAEAFEQRIADDPVRLISAATALEAAIVIEAKLGEAGGAELDFWLHEASVEIVPVDAEQADLARRAWRRLRQETQSRRAQFRRLLLLSAGGAEAGAAVFKGDDFSRTDIEAA